MRRIPDADELMADCGLRISDADVIHCYHSRLKSTISCSQFEIRYHQTLTTELRENSLSSEHTRRGDATIQASYTATSGAVGTYECTSNGAAYNRVGADGCG